MGLNGDFVPVERATGPEKSGEALRLEVEDLPSSTSA
jgi:hypothetical protein